MDFTSATRIVTSDRPGLWRTVHTGDFSISPDGDISGTIDRVVKYFDGVKLYMLSRLLADADTVFTAILVNPSELSAAAYLLRLSDAMRGSDSYDRILGFDGYDTLRGTAGTGQIFGGNGFDLLSGGTDSDNLRGDAGHDTLFGNGGSDFLSGDDGEDHLTGGSGNDLLGGGAGRDTFVFGLGDGKDTILGFEDGLDRITIQSGAVIFSDLTITGSMITFADVEIVLTLFDGSLLGAEDFMFN